MRTALLRFELRRERWILPIWILGILGLLGASGAAVAREFGDEQERFALAAIAASNPAFLFLRGLPDGSDVGALVFFQTFSFLAVLAGLMNTFLVVRHTRADEERGRTELLAATPLPRTAGLSTTLVIAASANILVAAASTGIGFALGFDGVASLVLGLAIGSVGIAFAGLAAFVAQVMPSPRGANGVAAALVGIAYLARGIGDALGTAIDPTHVEPSWISSLSPIGWAQASSPFTDANPLPLLAVVGLGVVSAAGALVVRSRRDLGASLVPERVGQPKWPRASATRLALRLQRGTTIGWAVGTIILGAFAGTLAPLVAEAVGSNDQLADLIGRLAPGLAADTGQVFTIALLGMAGTLAAASGVQAMIRMRSDEAEGRAELLLSTPLSRTGWLARQITVGVASMVVVALASGLAAGSSLALADGDAARLGESLLAVAVFLPAGSVFIALTAATFAFVPRATAALGWGLLALGLVLGQFGELIGLPEWLQDVSPFRHVPAVPIDAVEPWSMVISLAAAMVLAGAALVGFRRRDVPA